ncbi:MAG: trypsin-like peptidase domain-containing protein [Aeromicrobium sp.]
MTEPHDPFAARPYVPPPARTDETPDATDETSTADQPAADTDLTPREPEQTDASTAGPTETHSLDDDTGSASTDPVIPGTEAYANSYPTAHEYATRQHPADDEPTIGLDSYSSPMGTPAAPATPAAAPRRKRGRTLVSAVALVALAGGAGYGGSYLQDRLNDGGTTGVTSSSLDSGNATPTRLDAGAVEKVAAKVLPSVVQINVKGTSESGSGTGIIVSSDGQILTNNHVVAVAAKGGTITVAFSDGTNTEAEIVGRDPLTDIAVIKAKNKTGLAPATLGASADLQVGQEVVAIGSPFGLESTVTTGIVSALNRPVTSSDGTSSDTPTVFPAVQTDAAINPGNSGGPLVDLAGNVIGINSAIRAGTSVSGQAGSIGLGFAIPIDLAKNISKQLIAGGKVEHAQIGVSVRGAVSGDDITGIGAEVNTVNPGSAGSKAGLKKGDIITAVNGHAVATSDALVASIRAYQPGETIKVTYQRDGTTKTVDVTLGSDQDAS